MDACEVEMKNTVKCVVCQEENMQFEVVCDETNNSEQDIADKRMNVSITIRPYPSAFYCKKCGAFLNNK